MKEDINKDEVELNKQLAKWKKKLSKILDNESYDSIRISEIEYQTLKILGNADSYKDINSYLWNSGIDRVFESIESKIKSQR